MLIKNNDKNPRWLGDVLLVSGESGEISPEIMALDAHKELLVLGILSEDKGEAPISGEESAPVTRKKNG